MILKHFDEKVIQSAYEPYNGFNFYYLFVTSVCLITVSHFVNIFYWAVRRAVDPMVTAMKGCLIFNLMVFSSTDPTSKRPEFPSKGASFPDSSLRSHLVANPTFLPHHRADDHSGGGAPFDLCTLGGDGPREGSTHGCVQRYQNDR